MFIGSPLSVAIGMDSQSLPATTCNDAIFSDLMSLYCAKLLVATNADNVSINANRVVLIVCYLWGVVFLL